MRKVKYAVARAGDVPEGFGTVVSIGPDAECALFRSGDAWSAVGSLCPHQNASMEGAPAADGVVTCPRHGYRFNLRSGECLTTGGYGIPVYAVSVEDDVVYVSIWEYE